MKAKKNGGVLLTLTLLSACLSSQSVASPSFTDGLDNSIVTKVFPSEMPTMSATTSPIPSELQTSSSADLTARVSVGLTEFAAALSATPQPYWGLLPLHKTPVGGWETYTNEPYGFSFEYPSSYDTGSCGKLVVRESAQQFEIHVDGGTIVIKIIPANDVGLEPYAKRLIEENGYSPLTPVEDFMIDGIPAVRFILRMGLPRSAQYRKLALMIHQEKLYVFEYSFRNFVWCSAPPISEEAVYEYLISTWHFLP
jgi:hypothetical protein